MNKKVKDTLVVGMALFAMFLGAGNIIFPPFMGVNTGNLWWLAFIGYALTGTGMPMLGVLALSKVGGDSNNISKRVSIKFAAVLNTLILLFIGPLFAIPRTAATTMELSIQPYLGDVVSPGIIKFVGGAIFFIICLSLAISENNVIDRIGAILTPILVVFLLTMIVMSVVKPIGTPGEPARTTNIFYYGFSTGYQTMDGMGSIVMGGSAAFALMRKGYSREETSGMLKYVAMIAGIGLTVVYMGFTWIGASASKMFANAENLEHSDLTVQVVKLLGGNFGQALLAGIIFFACVTTATGLIVTASDYFSHLFKDKVSYRMIAIIVTVISYAISTIGVQNIITIAGPVLEVIYPVVIVLIILNLFNEKIRFDYAFRGAVFATIAVAIVIGLTFIPSAKEAAQNILNQIPLGSEGFGYIVPAVVGLIVGFGLEINKRIVSQSERMANMEARITDLEAKLLQFDSKAHKQ